MSNNRLNDLHTELAYNQKRLSKCLAIDISYYIAIINKITTEIAVITGKTGEISSINAEYQLKRESF